MRARFLRFRGAECIGEGTTAFTCVKGGGAKDFSDADCSKTVTAGTGSFGHVAIEAGKSTELNTKLAASFKLNTTRLTLATEITCTEATGAASFLENKAGPPMSAEGLGGVLLSVCTVNKPAKCRVKEPIVVSGSAGSVIISESPEEMGVEFSVSSEITLENKNFEKCALNGKTFVINGWVIGTPGATPSGHGAVLDFDKFESSMQKLAVGGEPATLDGAITAEMFGGNPIGFTTTAA